jgi:hypothetical protein
MSAFICSEEHLGALIRFLLDIRPSESRYLYLEGEEPKLISEIDWRDLFAELATENSLSVNHRYEGSQPDCQVDTIDVVTPTQRYLRHYRALKPVEVIKCCHCYAYQACEHPGWPESRAKKIIDTIIARACRKLPGYEEAPWGL